MTAKKGTGLLMVWSEVPADQEEEYNRWYDEEHIGDLLAVPGFLNGGRYQAVKGGPKYLACYEVESPAVFETETYMNLRANPSDWAKRMSPRVISTALIRNVYQQIFPETVSGAVAQSEMAPALQIGRMAVPAEIDDDFNQWYNAIYVPNYEKVPGCIRGRRYRALVGEPEYATVYEFEHEKVSESAQWNTARDLDTGSAVMRARMTHADGSPGIYRRIFPKL